MAGHDGSQLPSSSTSAHRLPTVSASHALQTLQAQGARAVPTGLTQLDSMLAPAGPPGRSVSGGYIRGKVTEMFGPPGVGKTAFGIQAAANALRDGHRVVWVDAACAPLVPQRFNEVLLAVSESATNVGSLPEVPRPSPDEVRSHFHHCAAPTLAHLIALFMQPPASFPPPHTALVVIDSLSTLFDNAYPRNVDDRVSRNKNEHTKWAAGRRFAVTNELIATLTKIAALHDIALIVLCQTITRVRPGSGALLVPAISGADWDNGISTRLVLFRDWVPGQGKSSSADAARLQKARFAGLLKVNGVVLSDDGGVGNVVPFTVERSGICDMSIAALDSAPPPLHAQARPPKRNFTEMDDDGGETPGSDELYGWIEDDAVAAEGLLIEEASTDGHDPDAASGATLAAESIADDAAERQRKVARPTTL